MKSEGALEDRVLADPGDREARLALARLHVQEGLAGQALAELEFLDRRDWLTRKDFEAYTSLLRERASERLALGDADAIEDWKKSGGESRSEYLALAAVAYLRHSSKFEKAKAYEFLRVLPAEDPRSLLGKEQDLSESQRLEVFEWLLQAGAKREALLVAQDYVDAGGRDPAILQRWRELHTWWFGDTRPALPSEAASLTREPDSALLSILQGVGVPADASAATLASDWGEPAWGEQLTSIVRAFERDPALAERLARRFISRAVYGARERAIIVELFFRLGDYARARDVAVELAELSAHMPAFSQVAGLASAAAGQMDAADLYFTSAAAASGDPGAYWAMAARVYRGLGHYLPALAACRKALTLTARGQDAAILLDLAFSQRALGREKDALATEEVLLASVEALDRARVQELLLIDAERGRLPSLLASIRDQLGF